LEEELIKNEKKENNRENTLHEWIVIWFNAWQHQRSSPAWWSVMDAVYNQSLNRLPFLSSLRLRIYENMWRIWNGLSHRFFWPALIMIVIATVLFFFDTGSIMNATKSAPKFLDFLQNRLGLVIASIVAILSGILTLNNSLAPGSIRAAREFVEMRRDPMNTLSNHYKNLVKWINHPIAVFIDDLDRCQDTYTVELLEGIQTLFKGVDVIYIVCPDRRWIYASYDKAYDAFKCAIDEPGRPMRFLFLEKIFQLSVPIPYIDSKLKQKFWEYLLMNVQENKSKTLENKLEQAEQIEQKTFEKFNTEREILEELKKDIDDPIEEYGKRAAAVVRLADLKLERDIENKLKPFGSLMEPNPRFMKRVVNSYGIAMSKDIQSRGPRAVEFGKLILWTILSLRWPRLSEYLEQNPNMIKHFGTNNVPPQVPEDIRNLFHDQNVTDVIKGNARNVSSSIDDESSIISLIGFL
jgi:hypothetical protein